MRLSLSALAELSESSKSYIWRLEMGDCIDPAADRIGRIARALDVTPEFLLGAPDPESMRDTTDARFLRHYAEMDASGRARLRRFMGHFDDDYD